jgi:hypothetical protein
MRTNKALIAFGVSAALLLVGLTARQATAAILPGVSICKGTIHNAGPQSGNFNAVSQSAVTGVKGACVSFSGIYSFSFADGSGLTVNFTGEVDSGAGGSCKDTSAVQPNGTKSLPGEGFVVWGTDPSGASTPLTGCMQLFSLTAFEALSGSAVTSTFPLSGSCPRAGSTGMSLCVGRAQ